MKLNILIASLLFFVSNGYSQSGIPEKIESSSDELEEISSEEDDAASLLLEYEVIRSSNFLSGKKIISQANLDSMSSIAAQINQSSPSSFHASYVQFRENGFTEEGYAHLENAENLTVNKSELYSDFLAAAHILDKSSELKKYASKLRSTGFIQNTVLEYNKNVLRSITENKAFIITNGWDDTYPLLTLLDEEKKKNVSVINMEWLYDANYRAKIAGKLGSPNHSFSNNPYAWINTVSQSSSQSIYFTPTLPNSELVKISNRLVPVGILFKQANLTLDEQNYESLKAWKKFSKASVTSSHPISKNYIILLTLLENSLLNNNNESGTRKQVQEFKTSLEEKHPSLK